MMLSCVMSVPREVLCASAGSERWREGETSGPVNEREREKEEQSRVLCRGGTGRGCGKGTVVGALFIVCMSLTMRERGRSRSLYNLA